MIPENNPHVQVLRQAIEAKQAVLINYDDTERLVEPHALGVSKKDEIVLRAWQTFTAGDSKAGWKMFKVDQARSISNMGNQAFEYPRPGYSQGDSAMKEIIAQL